MAMENICCGYKKGHSQELVVIRNIEEALNLDLVASLKEHKVAIVLVPIPDFIAEIDKLTHLLTADEKERVQRYQAYEAARNFLVCRALLRLLCAKILDLPSHLISFEISEHNKPLVANHLNSVQLQFNLSHSGSFGIFAFSLRHPVGIDIECSYKRNQDIIPLALAECELLELQRVEPPLQMFIFLKLWTQKEAICKALGQGLALSPKSLVVGLDRPTSFEIVIGNTSLTIFDISLPNELVISLAVDNLRHQLPHEI